ncbi:MAG TPA: hypothetical protein VNO30_27125 [Kofleriaceae bacterium]|nr:hypothetical protein [Kofleriaceae bacterium]
MLRRLVLLVLLALPALPVAAAAAPGEVTLAVPRKLQAGESIVLVVTVGAIQRGQQIWITTASGQQIGTVSPYGIPPGHEAGSYVVPVPVGAVRECKLSLQLRLTGGGGPPRAPTAQEVKAIELRITPAPSRRPAAHAPPAR